MFFDKCNFKYLSSYKCLSRNQSHCQFPGLKRWPGHYNSYTINSPKIIYLMNNQAKIFSLNRTIHGL